MHTGMHDLSSPSSIAPIRYPTISADSGTKAKRASRLVRDSKYENTCFVEQCGYGSDAPNTESGGATTLKNIDSCKLAMLDGMGVYARVRTSLTLLKIM